MALTLLASGTQTAVISTEHTLYTTVSGGIFVFIVDLVNMASGDTTELRIKSKVISGGPLEVTYFQSFTDAQSANNLITVSVPFPCDLVGVTFTLKQVGGVGRTYDWKILSL